jgi:hypothetical protein
MYATCIYCHSPLGRNEAIEPFPVGRRLAFDSAHGRLWVVCPQCSRWNLTPLEERWEAIEECERRFRGTKLRLSTDHIGLARLPEGVELIRVGEALRPELAAWRYVDRFRLRRRHAIRAGVLSGAALLALTGGGIMLGAGAAVGEVIWELQFWLRRWRRERAVVCRLPSATGTLSVRGEELSSVHWMPNDESAACALTVHSAGTWTRVQGEEAMRIASVALARFNANGGSAADVATAVRWLEAGNDPIADPATFQGYGALIARAAAVAGPVTAPRAGLLSPAAITHRAVLKTEGAVALYHLPRAIRLAMEIAVNDEQERAAMEGELAALEHAWREAEEIAAIADDLLLPEWVQRSVARWRAEREDAPHPSPPQAP